MHSGNPMTPDNPSFATAVGIAALVLEGRPLWEDEFDADETSGTADAVAAAAEQQQQQHHQQQPLQIDTNTAVVAVLAAVAVATSTPVRHSCTTPSPAASCSSVGSASSASSGSPCPNTPASSSASSASGGSAVGGGSSGGSGGGGGSSSGGGHVRSIPKALRDETVQHIQRLRQKLMLIRSAPGTSRDAAEQAIAVSGGAGDGHPMPMDSDDEPDDGYAYGFGGSFAAGGSALAAAAPQHQPQRCNGAGFLSSLQSLATNTCLNTTPRAMMRSPGLLQTVDSWSMSGGYFDGERLPMAAATAGVASVAACTARPRTPPRANSRSSSKEKTKGTPAAGAAATATATKKKMGPHCEEFLKKIGLIKCPSTSTDASVAKAPPTPRSSHARQQQQLPSPTTSVPYVEVHRCSAINPTVSATRNENGSYCRVTIEF